MNKPFVIAPTYLLQSCAVGQIERHFFQSIVTKGMKPIVVSAQYDIDPNSFNHPVVVVKENNIYRKVDLLCHKFGLRDLSHSPDYHYFALKNQILKVGEYLAKDGKIDYIHTISNPVSSHIIGSELKKKTGLPLVVQLYDLWHNNPFRKYKFPCFDKRDQRMEREVAEAADLIIFPNEELLDSWAEYGEHLKTKMCVIPFCTEIPKIQPFVHKDGELIISHIGTLSKERNSIHFLNAIASLKDRYPSIVDQIKVNYVGTITQEEIDLINSRGIRHIVNLVGRVSEEECFKYYEDSDMFLIIDIDCEPNLFYPSKLLKYFCYQKPIIGLTKKDSVVYHELSKTGNYLFRYEDEQSLEKFLLKAVTDYDSVNTNDKTYGERFSVVSVCNDYIKRVKEIFK